MKEYSQKFLKQRKFLTVLPLIVLPFVVLLFPLLGGGALEKNPGQTKSGLNIQLPDANLKNQSALDKMSFYAMADQDSVKCEEQVRMDPNYPAKASSEQVSNKEYAYLPKQSIYGPDLSVEDRSSSKNNSEADIDRLEMMLHSISQKKSDPEMEALNRALDKLQEIQNPERSKNEIISHKRDRGFAVTAHGIPMEDSYFGKSNLKHSDPFFSDANESKDSTQPGVILAVVHIQQNLLTGSVVKMRLIQDVFVNGEKIPSGSFVFGNTSISNERLKVSVSSIQFQNRLYPVALSVFDMDGLEGIHIPGSAGREVLKQSADQGIQSVSGLSLDPSLKAQAAAAGVNAAKSLLSKQVKQVRVTIKAGYQILLKDENEKSR